MKKALLVLPAALYGLAVQIRLWLYRSGIIKPRKLHNPVISVGNLTVGGTGKTPIVELIARRLREYGEAPVILSRGYKAIDISKNLLVSDGTNILMDWEDAGDEPFQLARNLTSTKVYIGKNRYISGQQAEGKGESCVFILDDGYQHVQLKRNLNILLIDATDPFGGGALLPIGRLREPIREIRRADIIVITRSDSPFDEETLTGAIRRYKPAIPILFAYHDVIGLFPVKEVDRRTDLNERRLNPIDIGEFFGQSVLTVAGIARPDLFVKDVQHFQIQVAGHMSFPDHHTYCASDVDTILAEARRLGVRAILTTEKDAIRLSHLYSDESPLYYLRIEARIMDEERLKFYIESCLGRFGA
ncbi:MAG: tetraacyldisaccharide 4'-kinase [Acidobacteria bacterium]|nr:tetraacyldisaccharide 4'-kinase [Acidobacteriota bacterium]MBI3657814.1 tetraacyldisaccharide 4'-kinase [Acidobacteriota bacterium]